jgi:uroporphyrinogen-III synthase
MDAMTNLTATPATQPSPTPPLAGVRVVITHDSEQAEAQRVRFSALGAETFLYPAIDLAPFENTDELDHALRQAADGVYDWLILNDADTILVVSERIKALGLDPSRFPRRLQVATIGCMTEQWTNELLGIRSDFAPEIYTPELVAEQLNLRPGIRVLVPQSATTRATLAKCLIGTGAEVDAINAYRTLIGKGGDAVPAMLWEGKVDAITFTFPTAVRYFAKRIKAEGGTLAMLDNVVVACIGPLTQTAAHDYGLHVDIVPQSHTITALVDAVATHFAAAKA